jgi:hypothetical protein
MFNLRCAVVDDDTDVVEYDVNVACGLGLCCVGGALVWSSNCCVG